MLWNSLCHAIFGAILLFLVPFHANAQQSASVGYVTFSDANASFAREACARLNAEGVSLQCIVDSSQGEISQMISRIENLIAQGVSGIVVQAGRPELNRALTDVLDKAKNAGIPVVAWSGTTLESTSDLAKFVTSRVGVSASELATQFAEVVASMPDRAKTFCLVPFEGPEADAAAIVTTQLENKGFSLLDGCKQTAKDEQSFLEVLSQQLSKDDIGFVIMPFAIITDEFGELNRLAHKTNRTTVFLSGWGDPVDLNVAATMAVLKAIPGETVEPQITIPGILQINVGPFCDPCDCAKDTRCKRECKKCQN